MVSAFHSPKLLDTMLEPEDTSSSFAAHTKTPRTRTTTDRSVQMKQALGASSSSHEKSDLGETTEDEEVKINCVGGVQSYLTTTDEDDDASTSDLSEDEEDGESVPTFVSRRVTPFKQLLRPQPLLGAVAEGDDEDDCHSETSHMQVSPTTQDDDEAAVDADDESSQGGGSDPEDMDDDDDDSDDESASQAGEIAFDRYSGSHNDGDESVMTAILLETSRILEEPQTTMYAFSQQSGSQLFYDGVSSSSSSQDVNRPQGSSAVLLPFDAQVMVTPESMPSPCGLKRVMSPIDLNHMGGDSKRMRWSPTTAMREVTVSPSSVESETEMDKQLGEELREADINSERESTPVPLLSPPPSPLCVESEIRGQMTTVCEWPCNLAVDSALTAIYCLRPPSPISLARITEEEEDRLVHLSHTGFTPLAISH